MNKLLVSALALASLVGVANAGVFTFSTLPGATESGGKIVNAKVTFTTNDDGTIDIQVWNLLTASQVKAVAQNISDLFFDLSNTSNAATVNSSGSTFIDVADDGSVTGATVSGTDKMQWLVANTGSTYHLDDLAGGAAGPAHTIIGGDGATSYGNANSSIAGNDPHNPFAQYEADWTLAIDGVTSDTQVSNVIFSFGTTSGNNVPTPEPASLAALGIGAAALLRRRMKSKA